MTDEIIYIDGYETKIEGRQPVWYAYKGKGKDRLSWRMPSAYQEMYDQKHLAIQKRSLELPEVLEDGLESEHYIPLLTGEADE